jgi:hypothetical protein
MKKHRSQCLAIAVSIATAAFALAESKPSAAKGPGGLPAEIAATVNGEPITNADLDQAFARAAQSRGMSVDAVPADQKAGVLKMILDDMINERLVTKASAAVKVEPAAVDAEFEKIRVARKASVEDVKKELATMGMTIETLKADIAKRMAQRQWVNDQIKDKAADATEAEAKEFYEKNPKSFETPEQVRASHILFRLTPDASPEKGDGDDEEGGGRGGAGEEGRFCKTRRRAERGAGREGARRRPELFPAQGRDGRAVRGGGVQAQEGRGFGRARADGIRLPCDQGHGSQGKREAGIRRGKAEHRRVSFKSEKRRRRLTN